MDFVKNLAGGNKEGEQSKPQQTEKKSGGGIMDKLNNAAGGGAAGEKNEDGLDKGSFFFFLSHLESINISPVVCFADMGKTQAWTGCRSTSWGRDLRTTSLRSSRPKMSRYQVGCSTHVLC